MKKCLTCHYEYEDNEFINNQNKVCTSCESCRIKKREYYNNLKNNDNLEEGYKKCIQCRNIHEDKKFTNKYGKVFVRCEDCRKEKRENKIFEYDDIEEGNKRCTACRNIYENEKFINDQNKVCVTCESCRKKDREKNKNINDDVEDGYKKCSKCKKIYIIENFINKNREYKYCVACRDKSKIRHKNYYQKNIETLRIRNRELSKKYYYSERGQQLKEEKREERCEYKKQHYENNKEEILQKQKEKYEENKDQILQKQKEYLSKNKERINERRRKLYQEKKEQILKRQKNYAANNWSIQFTIKHKQFDKQKGLYCDIDSKFLENLYEQSKNCHYCNIELDSQLGNYNPNQISCDRIDSSQGHCKDNIVLSCMFCNHAKSIAQYNDYKNFINKIKDDNYNIIHDTEKYDNGYAYKLLKSLRTYCKKEGIDVEHTPDTVRKLFKQQNGKSALTGIEMFPSKIPYYPFKPSLDRIDNNKPHTTDNLHLVCLAENMGRNSMTIEEFHDHIKNIRDVNNIEIIDNN